LNLDGGGSNDDDRRDWGSPGFRGAVVQREGRVKVGYISGPVDARVVHDSWRSATPLDYFGTSYLLQFYQVTVDLDIDLVVVTCHAGPRYDESRAGIHIMNRPRAPRGGLRYHLAEIAWLWGAVRETVRAGARTIVLTDAMLYWWALLPWRWRGIRFVNALHCVAMRPDVREPAARRALVWLMARLHYRFADPSLAASPLIAAQLAKLSGGRIDASLFLPTYAPEQFAAIAAPDPAPRAAFHVLFAGRVERNKGVFDLLEVCRRLRARGGPRFVFHVCGEGTASGELADETRRAGLDDVFVLHGFCDRPTLAARLAQSDAVIVPTRSDFEEGFAMIVAEGVIARRPVVTSRVCPALDVVRDAAIEVQPDDVAGYADAVWTLATDDALYARKVAATGPLRRSFFDEAWSYRTKLRTALQRLIR
jgi:glycosyltransferase involved in cell wall biosynthesis